MKKIPLIILTTLLLLCAIPLSGVWASEAEVLHKATDVSVAPESPYVYEGTASSNGTIHISTTPIGASGYVVDVYNADGSLKEQGSPQKPGDSWGWKSDFDVLAGESYVVSVYAYDGYTKIEGTASLEVSFTAVQGAQKEEWGFDTVYTIENPLLEGNYTLTLAQDADTTLYIFKPEATGIYKISANDGATVGYWGSGAHYVSNPHSTASSVEREIKQVGQSAVIGISSIGETVSLNIEKIGESEGITEKVYVTYQNTHTPTEGIYPSSGMMQALDISAPHTAVLGTDGLYHLDASNGPVLYMDLYSTSFNLSGAFGTYGALAMKGSYDGVDYDFKSAMKQYNDVLTDTDGYYPLTEDLIKFMKAYGENQGWYVSEISPFAAIASGKFNEQSAWMVLCCTTIGDSASNPIEVTDESASADSILFSTHAQTDNVPIYYKFDNDTNGYYMLITGANSFNVIYNGTTYTSSDGKILLPNIDIGAVLAVEGGGWFVLEAHIHKLDNLKKIDAIPSSCTSGGVAEYYLCTICGLKLDGEGCELSQEDITLSSAGHVRAQYVEEIPAGCFSAGTRGYYYCEVCQNKVDGRSPYATILTEDDLIIAPTGHTDVQRISAKAATCYENGAYAHYFCNICQSRLESNAPNSRILSEAEVVILSSGHVRAQKFDPRDATCTESGNIEYWYCSSCDGKYTGRAPEADCLTDEEIFTPATGHLYDGEDDAYCNVCGEERQIESQPPRDDNTEDNTEEGSEDNSEDNTEESTGDVTEDNTEDNSEDVSEDTSESTSEISSENNSENNSESPTEEATNPPTDNEDIESPTEDVTNIPEASEAPSQDDSCTEKKSGCASSVSFGTLAIAMSISMVCAISFKKKK